MRGDIGYSDVPHENRLILGTPKNKNKTKVQYLNLNLNSLLVKRQIDNPSPGAVTGGN